MTLLIVKAKCIFLFPPLKVKEKPRAEAAAGAHLDPSRLTTQDSNKLGARHLVTPKPATLIFHQKI